MHEHQFLEKRTNHQNISQFCALEYNKYCCRAVCSCAHVQVFSKTLGSEFHKTCAYVSETDSLGIVSGTSSRVVVASVVPQTPQTLPLGLAAQATATRSEGEWKETKHTRCTCWRTNTHHDMQDWDTVDSDASAHWTPATGSVLCAQESVRKESKPVLRSGLCSSNKVPEHWKHAQHLIGERWFGYWLHDNGFWMSGFLLNIWFNLCWHPGMQLFTSSTQSFYCNGVKLLRRDWILIQNKRLWKRKPVVMWLAKIFGAVLFSLEWAAHPEVWPFMQKQTPGGEQRAAWWERS